MKQRRSPGDTVTARTLGLAIDPDWSLEPSAETVVELSGRDVDVLADALNRISKALDEEESVVGARATKTLRLALQLA